MPFQPDDPWTCQTAIDACNAVVETLRSVGILEQGPFPDTVRSAVVLRCQPCRAGRGSNPRRCGGWTLSLRPENAIRIRGHAGGRGVIALIEGTSDRRHAIGVPASSLVSGGSMAVTVLDEEGALLTRQHSDVANVQQWGPVGHLQLGGLPSIGPRPPLEWLDQPRWPLPPMDLVLLAELALYSFAPEGWNRVRELPVWQEQVQRSESLAYTLWLTKLQEYWNQRGSGSTWLTEQCNVTTPWQR